MAKSRETKRRRLRVERVADMPLREVSGICLKRGRNRKMSLVRSAIMPRTWHGRPCRARKPQTRLAVVDLTRISGSKLPKRDPQIEAVCADGGGRVLLLQEAPPRAELVDLDASRVVASVTLRFEGRSQLARSWFVRMVHAERERCSCPAGTCSSPKRRIRRRSSSSVRATGHRISEWRCADLALESIPKANSRFVRGSDATNIDRSFTLLSKKWTAPSGCNC